MATNYPDSPLAQIPEGRRCSFACGWPRGSSFAQQKIPHIQVEWNATKAHPEAGSEKFVDVSIRFFIRFVKIGAFSNSAHADLRVT